MFFYCQWWLEKYAKTIKQSKCATQSLKDTWLMTEALIKHVIGLHSVSLSNHKIDRYYSDVMILHSHQLLKVLIYHFIAIQ